MILDDYFDRIVLLTLAPDGARARNARADLTGKNLSETAVRRRAIRGEEIAQPAWFQAGRGAWGCLNSHLRAVEDALRDGVRRLLVLEDDCVWLPEASRLARDFLEAAPNDWGQLYFGGQLRAEYPNEPLPGTMACRRAHSVHRAHAYAISRSTMPQYLRHVQHAPDYIAEAARATGKERHFDHQLEVAHRRGDWPIYVPDYWLAGQAENYSDVRDRLEPERWWQTPPAQVEHLVPLIFADKPPNPAQLRRLHFGYNLAPADPTVDLDVAQAGDAAELVRTMVIVAEEGWAHRRVPALHAWKEKRAILEKRWPAGVLSLSEVENLELLRDSLFSGSPKQIRTEP